MPIIGSRLEVADIYVRPEKEYPPIPEEISGPDVVIENEKPQAKKSAFMQFLSRFARS